MKELTKAEEQVMKYLWKLKKAFLKDVVSEFPEPRPAYTTISTVIRVLVKKKFIGFKQYGKTFEYYPLVSKDVYFKNHVNTLVTNFFSGSMTKFASFFTNNEKMDITDLEELKTLIDDKINKIKSQD
jgi:predicted transcriptional regulator